MTEPAVPTKVAQTQAAVTEQIQRSIHSPLYSFLATMVAVLVFLVWNKPQCIMRTRPDTWTGTTDRRIDYVKLARVTFCFALLTWAVLYLLTGALTTSSYWSKLSPPKDEDCETGEQGGSFCPTSGH